MKLFVTIYNDARLLGHFLRHYHAAGVTRFYIATAPEFRTEVASFADRHDIVLTDRLIVEDTILAENNAVTRLRALHQAPDEWVVITDLDEFIEFDEAIDSLAARAGEAGANVVRGIMLDRFSADGQLPEIAPDADLPTLLPVKSRFIREVMGGSDHKGVLVRGPLRPAAGAGHHRFEDEIVFAEVLPISHYKWIAGALERLRKTHGLILQAGIPWAIEHRRVFEHYALHGRFAWEQFGGQLAAAFQMEPPIACAVCGAAIAEAERAYALAHFGEALCRADQKMRRASPG
jgi:hypothetical protein